MPVEMHCHTLFSPDAHGTPEQLVDVAPERGITTLSITEHNSLYGQARAAARAAERGLRYIHGVELDATWNGRKFDFLAFGFDPADAAMNALARSNAAAYPRHFELYLEQYLARGYPISRQEVLAGLPARYPTHPAPVPNQWFARELLVAKGVYANLAESLKEQEQFNRRITEQHGPEVWPNFAAFARIRDATHAAGGVVLLAHVAGYGLGGRDEQIAVIRGLMGDGLDGFELYHKSNRREAGFERLVAEADALCCVISGGSDCHDAPGADAATGIGSVPVPDEVLARLDAALSRRR